MGWLARACNGLRAVVRAAWRPAATIRIPEAVLQRQVESRFPVEKTRYGCTLTLHDPAIRLRAGESPIALEVTLGVRFPGGLHPAWRGEIALRLDYRQDQGAFYLREPRLRSSAPDGMLAAYRDAVLQLVSLALDPVLAAAPVYVLDPAKGRHRLARCFLKSVAVRDRQLRVELGWGGHRDAAG
jgi:hypothetical protein